MDNYLAIGLSDGTAKVALYLKDTMIEDFKKFMVETYGDSLIETQVAE